MSGENEDLIGRLAELVAAVLAGDQVSAGVHAGDVSLRLDAREALVEPALRRVLRFDPVGLAEISAMTGESVQNLNYLMREWDPPPPVRLARMKVWRRSEVAVWWASIGREVTWTDTPEPPRQHEGGQAND
jgi:predicted DNA-binding transcriptional regulator AlpA